MRIDLKWMAHAHALAEHGTFSRAAAALGLTQPALSRSIQELEGNLGIRLFERTRAGVLPTDAGRLFLERSKGLLAQARDFEAHMDMLGGRNDGELRIGAGTYPAEMFVAEAMARTLRTHPRIRMRVMVDHWANHISMLRRHEIDVAVAGLAMGHPGTDIHVTELDCRQGFFAVRIGHPLTQTDNVSLATILTYPLLCIAQLPPPFMETFLRAAREGGLPPNQLRLPAIGCDSLSMIHTIAAGSDAVAITDLAVAMPHVQAGRLAILPLVEPAVSVRFGIFRLANRTHSPLGEAFVRVVTDAARESTETAARYSREILSRSTQRT